MADFGQQGGTPTPEKTVTHHATPVSVKKLMCLKHFNVYDFSDSVYGISHVLNFIIIQNNGIIRIHDSKTQENTHNEQLQNPKH